MMMKSFRNVLLVLLAVVGNARADVPPMPETPAAVRSLVFARPFTLATPYRDAWRPDGAEIASGYLLVLRVDSGLVFPRQTEEPVLYVGRQIAERVNVGYRSGHVIAIVPGVLDDPADPAHLDLTKALIWFGAPAMPERVDAAAIDLARKEATAAGIRPIATDRVEAAIERGGDTLVLATKKDLMREAMRLVKVHSPVERDLADGVLEARPAPE